MQIKEFLSSVSVSKINFVHTYIVPESNYPIKNKGRYHSGFIYTLYGTETYHFNDGNIEAVPGSVLYIPKGESYKITLNGKESGVIAIDFESPSATTRPFRVKFPENSAVRSVFSESESHFEQKSVSYMQDCFSCFYKIVGLMIKQISVNYPSKKYLLISGAVEYLNENYLDSAFRIENLTEITGISKRYFESLFRQKYDMSPKEYILSLKMERAKELLLGEKFLIKDIALSLGYGDIYHFGKIFKKKTGYTPREYRDLHDI